MLLCCSVAVLNPIVLVSEEVSKFHSVIFHNDVKGFNEGSESGRGVGKSQRW